MLIKDPSVGSSAETAVVVRSLWAEYTWLQEHLPGVMVVRRREVYADETLLDILTVESEGREAREVYFDVSACYYDRRPTLPCPFCGEPLVTVKARQCGQCFADFHDPGHVVYRKGLDHVDRVRAMAIQRRDAEASRPGLNDPRSAFSVQFRPTQSTADVVVLHFPDRLSALDARVFQIGVECLIADGCRGVVCDVEQLSRQIWRSTTSPDGEQLGLLVSRIARLLRSFVRGLVLVRGDALRKSMERFVPLENYESEADAIAALMSRAT